MNAKFRDVTKDFFNVKFCTAEASYALMTKTLYICQSPLCDLKKKKS